MEDRFHTREEKNALGAGCRPYAQRIWGRQEVFCERTEAKQEHNRGTAGEAVKLRSIHSGVDVYTSKLRSDISLHPN
ncbi:MAG: hypothetical protein ACRC1H_08935, partial [Caldilineaceae bacterium]